MELLWLNVDSALIYTLKNQLSHIETTIYKRNEQILWQNQKIMIYYKKWLTFY